VENIRKETSLENSKKLAEAQCELVNSSQQSHVIYTQDGLTAEQSIVTEYQLNLLTPNVNYSGRTAPLTSKVALYIFIQQI